MSVVIDFARAVRKRLNLLGGHPARGSPRGAGRRRPARRGALNLEGLESRTLLSFAAPPSSLLPVPGHATGLAVAVADFRGDGHRDLAAVAGTGGSAAVDVFLGNGDGSFQAARPAPVPFDSGPVAAGDFTGDGKADLVVGFTDNLEILLGNGDGSFRNGGEINIGFDVFPASIAVADFHGDGRQDIVVALDVGTVLELRGNGNGTFQAPVTVGSFNPSGSFAAVAGDVNNDGKQDLIVETGGRAQLLLGNGDGTFQSPVPFAPGFPLAAADANGDGIPDLVFATPTGISERLGNGDGTFQDPVAVNFAAGTPGTVIGAGDFTGNGRLDAVVENVRPPAVDLRPNAFGVLLNNGDGTFATAPAYATGQFPREVVAGDFTGSGLADLVTADSAGTHLLPNNGDGTFGSPITVAGFLGDLVTGDFNGDDNLDLAALSRSSEGLQVQVFLGNGDRTFQAPRSTVVGSSALIPKQMVAGDFDGDGKLDLAVLYEDTASGHGQSFVTVLLGNGDGTFRVTDTHQVAPASDRILASGLAAGDFNGDGHLDLVETNSDGTVNVLLGNGDGSFQDPVALHLGGNPSSVAAADLRGNGITDLIVTSTGPTDPGVSVLLGNGDGTFRAPVRYQVGTGAGSVLVGDFNGDGIPDLAVISAGHTASVLRGNGDGTFQDPVSYLAGDTPTSLVAADFNGDGALDLATANFRSNDVTVLLNRNDGPGGPPSRAPAGLAPAARPAAAAALSTGTRAGPVRVAESHPPAAAAVDAVFAAGRPAALVPPPAPPALAGAGVLSHRHKGDWAVAADAAGLADPLVNDL
jgi:hypothetical protein